MPEAGQRLMYTILAMRGERGSAWAAPATAEDRQLPALGETFQHMGRALACMRGGRINGLGRWTCTCTDNSGILRPFVWHLHRGESAQPVYNGGIVGRQCGLHLGGVRMHLGGNVPSREARHTAKPELVKA